jgi:hypothetical protein
MQVLPGYPSGRTGNAYRLSGTNRIGCGNPYLTQMSIHRSDISIMFQPDMNAQKAVISSLVNNAIHDRKHSIVTGLQVNPAMHGIVPCDGMDAIAVAGIYFKMFKWQADQAEADQHFHRA